MSNKNPLLEFFNFGKKQPVKLSYTKLALLCSKNLVKFLETSLFNINKFKNDDEDLWIDNWYEYNEDMIPKFQKKLEIDLISIGFPNKLLSTVKYDIYYMFRDHLKYNCYATIKPTVNNIRKYIIKYNNKPYEIWDKSKLKDACKVHNVELVD